MLAAILTTMTRMTSFLKVFLGIKNKKIPNELEGYSEDEIRPICNRGNQKYREDSEESGEGEDAFFYGEGDHDDDQEYKEFLKLHDPNKNYFFDSSPVNLSEYIVGYENYSKYPVFEEPKDDYEYLKNIPAYDYYTCKT
jgi:hypothetical protein